MFNERFSWFKTESVFCALVILVPIRIAKLHSRLRVSLLAPSVLSHSSARSSVLWRFFFLFFSFLFHFFLSCLHSAGLSRDASFLGGGVSLLASN